MSETPWDTLIGNPEDKLKAETSRIYEVQCKALLSKYYNEIFRSIKTGHQDHSAHLKYGRADSSGVDHQIFIKNIYLWYLFRVPCHKRKKRNLFRTTLLSVCACLFARLSVRMLRPSSQEPAKLSCFNCNTSDNASYLLETSPALQYIYQVYCQTQTWIEREDDPELKYTIMKLVTRLLSPHSTIYSYNILWLQ